MAEILTCRIPRADADPCTTRPGRARQARQVISEEVPDILLVVTSRVVELGNAMCASEVICTYLGYVCIYVYMYVEV